MLLEAGTDWNETKAGEQRVLLPKSKHNHCHSSSNYDFLLGIVKLLIKLLILREGNTGVDLFC